MENQKMKIKKRKSLKWISPNPICHDRLYEWLRATTDKTKCRISFIVPVI